MSRIRASASWERHELPVQIKRTVFLTANSPSARNTRALLDLGSVDDYLTILSSDPDQDQQRHELLADDWRIGIGFDIHEVVTGRPLRLGGLTLDSARGLGGHSDGDVVLHAIIDALFGAAGLGDIGEHFPDTDPRWAGCDSRELVARAMREVRDRRWGVHNLDVIVITERPRLASHKGPMAAAVAQLLDTAPERVSIKAKTHEGLDAVGRGEAMSCHAAVLLKRTE